MENKKAQRTTHNLVNNGFNSMRRFVALFNFSCTLIGNRPQTLTGHIVKRSILQTEHQKMNIKKSILIIFLTTIWISISEFVRNTFLIHSYWTTHFQSLGLTFPEQPINGAI